MNDKETVLQNLGDLRSLLDDLNQKLRQVNHVLINPSMINGTVRQAVRLWSEKLELPLQRFGIAAEVLSDYHSGLEHIFKLSNKRNQRSSYLKELKDLLKGFHEDLEQHVLFHGGADPSEAIKRIIAAIPYPDQKGYLDEALRCVNADCKRATAVLGWSAAMHQIHSKIEEIGYAEFNTASDALNKQQKGRFKGRKGPGPINSISDLREARDREILNVLDSMEILESNQCGRLEYCLDMRIQASHPGDAEVTLENLESFFSDLSTLVFQNPKLQV